MDLTKILKAGDTVYSLIHAKNVKIKAIEPNHDSPIKIGNFSFNKYGSPIPKGQDCLICPSATEQTWDNYSPFKTGDIVLVYDNGVDEKYVRVFSHKENGKYFVTDYIDTNFKLGFSQFENCEYLTKIFADTNISA